MGGSAKFRSSIAGYETEWLLSQEHHNTIPGTRRRNNLVWDSMFRGGSCRQAGRLGGGDRQRKRKGIEGRERGGSWKGER